MDTAAVLVSILERVRGILWDPYAGQTAFWCGSAWTLLFALMLGYASKMLLFFRGKILRFFAPSKLPATNNGPSPASDLAGCLKSVFVLTVLCAVIALLIFI